MIVALLIVSACLIVAGIAIGFTARSQGRALFGMTVICLGLAADFAVLAMWP